MRRDYVDNREKRCADVREYQDKNRQSTLEKKRKQWHELKQDPVRYAKYIEKRKVNRRWLQMKRIHGISKEYYEELLKNQNELCAICGRTQTIHGTITQLVVDHNHESGEIRGLLCSNCNIGLGMFKDDSNCLRKAAEYVESRSCSGHKRRKR